MIPFYVLWYLFYFLVFVLSGPDSVVESDDDYLKLKYYAKVASVAYCLKKGLTNGYLADEDTNCAKSVCKDEALRNIRVVRTFNFNKKGDTGSGYYAVDSSRKEILLVFQGTSSRRDWLSDIDIMPVKYEHLMEIDSSQFTANCDGCKVHRGFLAFLQSNGVWLINEVQRLIDDNPDFQLILLGHSLGAALNTLIAIEFRLMGYVPLVLNYASPKVGNKAFTSFIDEIFDTASLKDEIESSHTFSKGLIRVVHTEDIVTKLPPSPIFKHAGYKYYISKKKIPHEAYDIERRGVYLDYENDIEDHDLEGEEVLSKSMQLLKKLLSKSSSKYAHSRYFLKMTGCNGPK